MCMHCDHSWRRWLTLPWYWRAYRVHSLSHLQEYTFWGGAIRFYVDRLAGYDYEYTLEFFRLIRIDLDVDIKRFSKPKIIIVEAK
jgi:hypothetical protein